jgi:hypothetical protein
MFPHVAASQPMTGHMVFVEAHQATLSRYSVPQHLCPSAYKALDCLATVTSTGPYHGYITTDRAKQCRRDSQSVSQLRTAVTEAWLVQEPRGRGMSRVGSHHQAAH